MPRYRDDQCEECGGIRVAKSTLCANCLVRAYAKVNRQIAKADLRVIVMEKDIKEKDLMLDMLIRHGFERNRLIHLLYQQVEELRQQELGGQKDGKNRQAENTEKG